MIKLSEILKAINSKLAEAFPDIKIDSKDLSEKFNRPSFRTELTSIKTENFMNFYKEREIVARIYYFPSDLNKNRIECLEIIEQLESLFKPYLKIKDRFVVHILEMEFEEVDKTIIANFNLSNMEEIEEDLTGELMQELTTTLNSSINKE